MKIKIFTTILSLILLLLVITPSRAVSLSQRLSGKILLQVQEHGEAWYVYPNDLERHYLGRPADAFRIMRELGLGISERDYNSFYGYAPSRLSGRILLRVEANGEAYYVNSVDLRMYYLGRPADAFRIMRELGLGITNADLEEISITQGEESLSDAAAPVISNLQISDITDCFAQISWNTDEKSNGFVEYGLTTDYGSIVIGKGRTTSRSLNLTNLIIGTTYHFRAKSIDTFGNIALSEDYSFTTQSKTAIVALEENIPGIKNYPRFEQTAMDFYSSDGLTDSEIKYIKALFDIFKLKTNLHQADEETLAYLLTNTIEPDMHLSKGYAMDIKFFVEELIPLANEITEGSFSEIESIEKIVQWVRENINEKWDTGSIDDTPKDILERRETPTACDYWATLITAFCRAIGIPAREVSGGLRTGHAWTEAYVDKDWILVESTGYLEENPEGKKWLYSVHVYDPLNDRLMDVSLSYNTDVLDLIIEHAKETTGETSAIKQAQEIFTQYKKENDLANKYTYAQEIMDICIKETIAEDEVYGSTDIKVLNLWDRDKLKKEESFLNELKTAKAIAVYDITPTGKIRYKGGGMDEFPLEKINTVIPEIKQHFQGEIYFFFAHYLSMCGSLSDAVTINLFNPEDVDALEMAYHDLFTGTPELLRDLVIEISHVASKEKDSTTFNLPKDIQDRTSYIIVTVAPFKTKDTAWEIYFEIQSMNTIQDIVMVLSVGQTIVKIPDEYIKWRSFDNVKLVDKEGKVYADPEIYRNPRPDPKVVGAPYKDAPSNIAIEPGQILEIYRENNVIIIKGDLKDWLFYEHWSL